MLASNYYACLSLPPCQVEEHKQTRTQVAFKTTIKISSSTPPETRNKIRIQWDWLVWKRKEKEKCNNTNKIKSPATPTHIIGVNNEEIREAMRMGKIASTVADS
jgi:hypothetical protein